MMPHDVLQGLRSHPVFSIAESLARFTGIGRSLVPLTEYLSLCAGKKGIPVNIDLMTDQGAVDQLVADRLLSIDRDAVARVDTFRQFLAAERGGLRDWR
jgi:hypothetical protein